MQSPARPDPIALTWLQRSGRGSSSAPPPASSLGWGGLPWSPGSTQHPQPHGVTRQVLATPCASPTQNLPPPPPRLPPLKLREGAIERGNGEGGGWVTSAPSTLSPGRKGQHGGAADYRQQSPLPGPASPHELCLHPTAAGPHRHKDIKCVSARAGVSAVPVPMEHAGVPKTISYLKQSACQSAFSACRYCPS